MYYEELFAKLQAANVKYLVIGGLAMNLHSVPRMTADVDLIVSFAEPDITALIAALDELGFAPRAPVSAAELADPRQRQQWRAEKNMRAFTFVNKNNPLEEVDILLNPPFDFDAAYERREQVGAGAVTVNVASIDDLILTKKNTGRMQDASDIAALEAVKEVISEEGDARDQE